MHSGSKLQVFLLNVVLEEIKEMGNDGRIPWLMKPGDSKRFLRRV
jgi:hypothetical protein